TNRCIVKLKISTMNYGANWSIYDETYGVGYAVANGEELYFEFSQGELTARRYNIKFSP
ncbi:unnamed protein product, partial [marine sediment metagenome]